MNSTSRLDRRVPLYPVCFVQVLHLAQWYFLMYRWTVCGRYGIPQECLGSGSFHCHLFLEENGLTNSAIPLSGLVRFAAYCSDKKVNLVICYELNQWSNHCLRKWQYFGSLIDDCIRTLQAKFKHPSWNGVRGMNPGINGVGKLGQLLGH